MHEIIKNKRIAVTGGAGTIGRLIVKKLLFYEPKVIRAIDINETGLFELEEELKSDKVRYLIGDVRDKNRMKHAINDIDIVFHTAALKHVKSSEYNPFEAIKTNVIGLQNILDVCIEENVEKFIFTSSDKATNPANVMGTTKLLGEKLVTAANYYKGNKRCIFSSVRFGNIIGSRGSVLEVFKGQIKMGLPVTLTDGNMTRFMMSQKESIDLIFKAVSLMIGGEVFILKMPSVRMKDFTDAAIEEISKKLGMDGVKIDHIGPKPGEKVYEELMTKEESKRALETDDMFIIIPEMKELRKNEYNYYTCRKSDIKDYTSNDTTLKKEKIIELLQNTESL